MLQKLLQSHLNYKNINPFSFSPWEERGKIPSPVVEVPIAIGRDGSKMDKKKTKLY
jgi:hypothetical protein